jgi:outer membrane receptor protein involved in Fe transport
MNLLAAFLYAVSLGSGTIQGIVRTEGSGEPIASAVVSIPELQRRTITDARGFFVLAGLPDGSWRVEASGLGYKGNGVAVVIANANTIRLDFDLAVLPVALPRVVVQTAGDSTALRVPDDPGPAPVRISGAALKTLPGLAEADVFRALQTLPSISAISDYSSALYVRGGSAEQNLIQLDGVPIFNPYHVGGLFSAIGADAVSSVDVWPGALPATTGDRLSSVVSIHTREGGKDYIRTSGSIGLLSTTLTLDGPLNKGRGSFLFSGRNTYLDVVTAAARRLGAIDIAMPYGFSDAYLKGTHKIGELGSLSISGYWNGEGIDAPVVESNGIVDFFGEMHWGPRMLALSYRQPLAGTLLLEARAAYSSFDAVFDLWDVTYGGTLCTETNCEIVGPVDTTHVMRAISFTRDLIGAAGLTWFGHTHTLRAGLQLDDYDFHNAFISTEINDDALRPFDDRRRARSLALYLEDEWTPTPRLGLRAGLRFLHAGELGQALLPRLGARYQLSESLALTAGFGHYAQTLRNMKDDESVAASFVAYDVLTAQPVEAGLARAQDAVLGLAYNTGRTSLRIDAFRKQMNRLVLAPQHTKDPMEIPPAIVDSFRIGQGSAHGVEVSARRVQGGWDLGLSYSLLFVERRAGDDVFAPRHERRHEFDASLERTLGRRGLFSTRLVVGSGQPVTPVLGVLQHMEYDPVRNQWLPVSGSPLLGEHNSARLPGYLRLDLALRKSYERRWFGRDGTLTPYLQIVNVLNTKNPLIAEAKLYGTRAPGLSPDGSRPVHEYLPQLPFLPTFGLEWRF